MTLKRWITGKELMEFMDLTQHELYEFTVLGLPVYDQAGRFIINSMKAKTPGTVTRLGAVYVDTSSKMFVEMIGYKKFKVDEVRGFLEERDLMHLIPKPAAAEPTQTPETAKTPQEKKPFSIPVPDGTTWAQITFRIVNDEFVEVSYPGKRVNMETSTLGFKDKEILWALLKLFAKDKGTLNLSNGPVNGPVKANVSNLRKHLQNIFPSLKGKPIKDYSRVNGYECNFKISTIEQ